MSFGLILQAKQTQTKRNRPKRTYRKLRNIDIWPKKTGITTLL